MQVEIWSDIVCPWCYIGKRRFEAALARFEHAGEVEIVWRSFELDPSAPARLDRALDVSLADKYGVSLEQARAMQQHMTEAAAAEGLDFRFDLAQSGNTFDGHRVLHLAGDRGVQGAVKERLMKAYYSEGAAVTEHEGLVRLAAEAGLKEADVRKVLAGDAYADAVRADEQLAAQIGIRGVPFFVLNRTHAVSGAQPAEVLLSALQAAWTQEHPLVMVGSAAAEESNAQCADGSCAV